MSWTEKDLQKMKAKGLKITDSKPLEFERIKKPKKKIVKISIEKKAIEYWLDMFKHNHLISSYVAEYRFHSVRRFRFDWAIVDLKIAIEYEGIYSKKSRHTTVSGYTGDIEKYNLALTEGWRVLRYTASNYQNIEHDLMKLLNINPEQIDTTYCRLHTSRAIDEKCKKQCNSCLVK